MPLENFPLLQDNTRLIRFKDTLYKLKVKYKLNTFPDEDVNVTEAEAHDEIEHTFRAVLYLSERNQALKTISTPSFLISPYKIPWSFPRQCSDYVFQQNGKVLKVFDHMYVFHVSKRDDVENISKNASSTGLGLSGVQGEENKKRTVPHKEIVVIVQDINQSTYQGISRFGRTKGGQLYRVCKGNGIPEQSISGIHERKSRDIRSEERVHRARRKKMSDVTEQSEESDVVTAEKSENKHSPKGGRRKSTQSEVMTVDRKDVMRKVLKQQVISLSNKKTKKLVATCASATGRDKFSLRLSELRELRGQNIQQHRLRKRTEETTSCGGLSQSTTTRRQAYVVKYKETDTVSERESSEDGNELPHKEIIRTRRLRDTDQRKKKVHVHASKNTKIDSNIVSNSATASETHVMNLTERSKRLQNKERTQVKRLKNRREITSNKHKDKKSRDDLDTSSQSEPEMANKPDVNIERIKQDVLSKGKPGRVSGHPNRSSKRLCRSGRAYIYKNEGKRDSSIESNENIEYRTQRTSYSQRISRRTLNRDTSLTGDEAETDLDNSVDRYSRSVDNGRKMLRIPGHVSMSSDDDIGNSKLSRSDRRPVSTNDKHRNSRMSQKSGYAPVSTDTERIGSRKLRSGHVSTDDEHRGITNVRRASPRYADKIQHSSVLGSDCELGRSPTKVRKLERRKKSVTDSEEETNSAIASEVSSRSRKVRLYASNNSPQVIIPSGSKAVVEVCSPRVSTVLPVKRNHSAATNQHSQASQPDVPSPRITRQSLHDEDSRRIHVLHDEDSRRIHQLQEERPTQIYRDIMLTQGRDRHMVEQVGLCDPANGTNLQYTMLRTTRQINYGSCLNRLSIGHLQD